MATQQQLLNAFDTLLQPGRVKDCGPNGLQVEGKAEVACIVSGVTASRGPIEAAIAARADAVFVHHGLFWRGQDGRVTGGMKQRLALLLGHDINLFTYHLPLDAHPDLGNNVQVGLKLGLRATGRFGEQELGFLGERDDGTFADSPALASHLEMVLGRAVVQVPGAARPIRTGAWCTGGAQGYFEDAIAAGADGFVTGEISEPQAHSARECGAAYFAFGHYASEAAHVAAGCGIEHRFIDIDNPA